MPVRLAQNLELPDNAITQTFAFIARKGAGKTHNAGKLVEGLLLIGAPVIVLDPVGNWYGLRLSANGKSKAFEIPVFGGEHGDIPLEESNGARLGQLLVERDMAAVVDVSHFTQNEMRRFVTDFAEAVYHHAKRNRRARMVVLEEAQLFAPQHTPKGHERMLGAIERIVRLGRNFGLGSTMISQRPQSINKEVLNQVECLCVGQLNAVHERKAIEAWVLGHGVEKDWTNSLPELPIGTMIVWSPQWLGIMKQVKFSKKTSYDASATPELGTITVAPKQLTEVDVEWLKTELVADKPAKGRKGAGVVTPAVTPAVTAELADLKAQLEATRAAAGRERANLAQVLAGLAAELGKVSADLQQLGQRALEHPALAGTVEPKNFFLNERQEEHTTKAAVRKERLLARIKHVKGQEVTERAGGTEHLKAGALRMIEILAAFHPGKMSKAQLARAAEMKVTGGTFGQYWGALNRQGYLMRVGQDDYVATEKALQMLGKDRLVIPSDFGARVLFWEERLKAGEIDMLRSIVHAGDRGITKETLAEATSMTMTGGTFGAYLGTLTRNRLVTKDGGVLKVHPWLKGKE
jgi:uncharacterized protein